MNIVVEKDNRRRKRLTKGPQVVLELKNITYQSFIRWPEINVMANVIQWLLHWLTHAIYLIHP